MGCSDSTIAPVEDDNSYSGSSSVQCQQVLTLSEVLVLYTADGSLRGINPQKSEIELRTLLDYPIALQYLTNAVRSLSIDKEKFLPCWMDIRLYCTAKREDMKGHMVAMIYHKYASDKNIASVLIWKVVKDCIDSGSFSNDLFANVQDICFKGLHEVFMKFKGTDAFNEMGKALRRRYNRTRVGDFEYISVLGKGSYGLVCKVRKRSTGHFYAMKLQRKETVASLYAGDETRVNFEKLAFATLHHPFMVELFYALQTKSLAILVMSLGSGVDLSGILRRNGPLSQEQVLFYSAEITSALSYLHCKGLVYRDLKPANVLLNEDGHIQLVDFGAVCDLEGKTFAVSNDIATLAPVFAQSDGDNNLPLSMIWGQTQLDSQLSSDAQLSVIDTLEISASSRNISSNHFDFVSGSPSNTDSSAVFCESPRAKSLVGTFGYMAPEMVTLMIQAEASAGYTKAVDWWSLGVTIYKLLLAEYPFKVDRKPNPEGGTATLQQVSWEHYSSLLEEVDYVALAKYPDLVDFISQLLCVVESRRLGYGHSGTVAVSVHPYFKSIDWVALEKKSLKPPCLPNGVANEESKKPKSSFLSLSHLLNKVGYGYWQKVGGAKGGDGEEISAAENAQLQNLFLQWDYMSPSAIVDELKMSEQTPCT